MQATLILENGQTFVGTSIGSAEDRVCEMVFNTSMVGYQEILTDPSYAGQGVVMTYPLIGNYGVNPEDMESAGVHPRAFLVREYQGRPSNFRATSTLADFLRQYNVLGVEGLDTRLLTRRLRTVGAMRAVVSTLDLDPDSLVRRARAWAGLVGRDMVARVSCAAPYRWEGNAPVTGDGFPETADGRFRVVAYDFGIKYNQLRLLSRRGCRVRGVVDNLRSLLGRVPVFGICLGHQMLGLAYGATTYKLKFGHRGGNQPVKDLLTGRVEITAQNHGFCVDPATLPPSVEVTHINLNDGSLEGMRHREGPAFSVQYHPEYAPGPHDSEYLFDRFIHLMEQAG